MLALSILCNLLVLTSAQDLTLTFSRISLSLNIITLRCEDNDENLVSSPEFFKDDLHFELPFRQEVATGARFQVTRDIEGRYQCGRTQDANNAQRSLPVVIVALPSSSNDRPENEETEFEFDEGDVARIDCPIPPGSQVSNYYVRWTNATDPTIVFYEISFTRSPQVVRHSDRYSIDEETFALLISGVTPGDMISQYQCLLGVEENPETPNGRHTYDLAGGRNLSLSITKLPEFEVEPMPQTVDVGTTASFTCAVLSSPDVAIIRWQHGNIDPSSDTRYSIEVTHMPNSNQEEGGVVTTSVLNITNVDGLDSNPVRCQASYSARMLGEIQANVTLTVLDSVQFNVIPLQEGGFILKVRPKQRLLDPVKLKVNFTDAASSDSEPICMTTDALFTDRREIIHVVVLDDIPRFSNFTLKVALAQGRITGPFTERNTQFTRLPPAPVCPPVESGNGFKIAAIVTSTVLGSVFVVIIISVCVLVIWLRQKDDDGDNDKPSTGETIRGNTTSTLLLIRGNGCVCCPKGPVMDKGPVMEGNVSTQPRGRTQSCGENSVTRNRNRNDVEVSKHGFNETCAKKYVKTIKTSIKFGKSDEVISRFLLRDRDDFRMLLDLHASVEPEPGPEAREAAEAREKQQTNEITDESGHFKLHNAN